MTISLYIDQDTKEKAASKAKLDQLSFSAVVRILLSEYASGNIKIGARAVNSYEIANIPVDAKTQKKMDNVVQKWRNKKK